MTVLRYRGGPSSAIGTFAPKRGATFERRLRPQRSLKPFPCLPDEELSVREVLVTRRSDRRGVACNQLDDGFATGLKSRGLVRIGSPGSAVPDKH